MKKKIKKSWWSSNAGTIGVVAVLLGAYTIAHYEGESHFKIEKLECENMTVIEDIPFPLHLVCSFKDRTRVRECIEKAERDCLNTGGELWEDKYFDFTSYCIYRDWEYEKEVCGKVEVDEIEIPHQEKIKICWGGDEYTKCDEKDGWRIEFMPTEDLTTEWLNENTECIEEVARCKLTERLVCDLCTKWKLNNYTITKWEQTK